MLWLRCGRQSWRRFEFGIGKGGRLELLRRGVACRTFEFTEKFMDYQNYIVDRLRSAVRIKRVTFYHLKKLQTTPLMTRLRCSHENPAALDLLEIAIYGCSFVVLYGLPSRFQSIAETCYTMTEFKKKKPFALYSLCESRERNTISVGDTTYFLWNHPLKIRAVTDFDKDFRKIYRNGILDYEGNQYGDTSDFYIIGIKQE